MTKLHLIIYDSYRNGIVADGRLPLMVHQAKAWGLYIHSKGLYTNQKDVLIFDGVGITRDQLNGVFIRRMIELPAASGPVCVAPENIFIKLRTSDMRSQRVEMYKSMLHKNMGDTLTAIMEQ